MGFARSDGIRAGGTHTSSRLGWSVAAHEAGWPLPGRDDAD